MVAPQTGKQTAAGLSPGPVGADSSRTRSLDVICLGRAAVDLYGQQVGGRLEDMQSFAKYLGGSSGNLAAGLARLGVRSSMLTRVGDEQMGRFVREALASEGVDVSHVVTDPRRLTALVILGISGRDSFPHVFYRENCADLAIEPSDFDEDYIASSRSLAITGTHLSTEQSRMVVSQAVRYARRNDVRVVLDIDYRPVLWGLVAPGSGEERYVTSDAATGAIRELLPDCDLVVGTEEEIRIAGRADSTIDSLHNIRERSAAAIVFKRGAIGCSVFDGAIPADIDSGISAAGVEVAVFNTLGAGDGFLSGFLLGWLDGADWRECGALGNACGALVVSRHGCTPAMPTKAELDNYVSRAAGIRRPDRDSELAYLHRVSVRRRAPREMFVLAFDQRRRMAELAHACESTDADIRRFKSIVCLAVEQVGSYDNGVAELGVVVDERYGEAVLSRMTNAGWWIARPVEMPGSRPVRFEPRDNMGLPLSSWPGSHVVKCLVQYRTDDPMALRLEQERLVCQLHADCIDLDRQLLLALVAPADSEGGGDATITDAMRRFYNLGVFPAWWQLETQTAEVWQEVGEVVSERDPYCNGILVLDAPEDDLAGIFRVAAANPVCKGFTLGWSLLEGVARRWFAGEVNDGEAVERIATDFRRAIGIWRDAAHTASGEKLSHRLDE